LENDPEVTNADTIGFTWTEGLSNGSSNVLDYSVYYDQGLDTYILLAAGITNSYETNVDLIPNVVYSFKVTARNSVGDSLMSDPISIRAAEVADAPVSILNIPATTTAYQIGLEWTDGAYDGGSPVIDYEVYYAVERLTEDDPIPTDPLTYSIFETGVQKPHTITGLTPGVVYSFKVKSRNLVGYSDLSDPTSILAAQIPDAPVDLSNVEIITTAT
jgi:hypothetical protein